MNNERYDERQDPEYLAWLDSKKASAHHESENLPARAQAPYRPNNRDREFTPQRTDKNGQGWDKSVQQSEVVRKFPRSYKSRDGKQIPAGAVHLVIKEFNGNRFISLENWKPPKKEGNDYKVGDVWSGAVNLRVVELRDIGSALLDLADHLDGGEIK